MRLKQSDITRREIQALEVFRSDPTLKVSAFNAILAGQCEPTMNLRRLARIKAAAKKGAKRVPARETAPIKAASAPKARRRTKRTVAGVPSNLVVG